MNNKPLDISTLKRKNFLAEDFIKSRKALIHKIDNQVYDPIILKNLARTANKAQEIRDFLNRIMIITSCYRCEILNKLVKGKPASQHLKGEAFDFYCPNLSNNKNIIILLKESGIEVDQCLMEGSWIHISIKEKNNRNQFAYYLPDKNGKRKLILI